MIVDFYSSSFNSISLIKDRVLVVLTEQQKRVTVIALLVLASIAAIFLVRTMPTLGNKLNKVSIPEEEDLSIPKKQQTEDVLILERERLKEELLSLEGQRVKEASFIPKIQQKVKELKLEREQLKKELLVLKGQVAEKEQEMLLMLAKQPLLSEKKEGEKLLVPEENEVVITKEQQVKEVLIPEEKKMTILDFQGLEERLSAKVISQPYAVKASVEALMRYESGLKGAQSPMGVLLYVGPTGSGKTQLAKEITIELFGSVGHLIRMDMSSFQEKVSLTRLIGVSPGYIGHGEGGQLTQILKKQSKAVVLLDEIDKAHPDVLKVFLRAFDEGFICDSQNTVISCADVLFILTTNLSADKILKLSEGEHSKESIIENIESDLATHFSPEFYNRLEICPFLGLDKDRAGEIILLFLKEYKSLLFEKKQIIVEWDESVVEFIENQGFNPAFGARPLEKLVKKNIITILAQEICLGKIHSGDSIKVSVISNKVHIEKISPEMEAP